MRKRRWEQRWWDLRVPLYQIHDPAPPDLGRDRAPEQQQEFPTSLLRLFQLALRINSDEDLVAISQPLRLRISFFARHVNP